MTTTAAFLAGVALGFGLGAFVGACLMASLRISARYDRELETMCTDIGMGETPRGIHEAGLAIHDFTGGKP